MSVQIQIRRDTPENWTSNNPVLAIGETGYELSSVSGVPGKSKVGDGVTAWSDLKYTETLRSSLTAAIPSGNLGGVSNGQTFSAGTSIESVIRSLLSQAQHPTYNIPGLNFSLSASFDGSSNSFNTSNQLSIDIETGAYINDVSLSLTCAQNQASSLDTWAILENGSVLVTGDSENNPITDGQPQSTNGTGDINAADGNFANYGAALDYGQSVTLPDNLGNPDSTGSFSSGSLVRTIRLYGYRKMFYTSDSTTSTPNNSASVRGLSGSYLNPQPGYTFTINVPIGAKRTIIALPSSFQNISSIQYVQNSNQQIVSTFNTSTVSVDGANDLYSTDYKVYSLTYALAPSSPLTYNVTL